MTERGKPLAKTERRKPLAITKKALT